jgi:hypothetical protein
MAEIKYAGIIDIANNNVINNENFIKFGIHLFLGQTDAIDNKIMGMSKFKQYTSTDVSTVKPTGKMNLRDSCKANFANNVTSDDKVTNYISALTSAQLDIKYHNENQKVTDAKINELKLGAAGAAADDTDNTGIKRALKAVVECFIRPEQRTNNNYDLFRKWLMLGYDELVNDDKKSPLAFSDNEQLKSKVIIDRWIKYRIENSTDQNIETFKDVNSIVNTLSLSIISDEKEVLANFDNLPNTEKKLVNIKESFEKLSKQSINEYKIEAEKKGNSLYNDLLVQNELMKYFIKEANNDKKVEPDESIDKIIINLQYLQCKVLVAILDGNNNGLSNDNKDILNATLNKVAANTRKFTGRSTNNDEAAGADPRDKPGWRWSGGTGDGGTPDNLHDVALQSAAVINLDDYKAILAGLKNLYENSPGDGKSFITPLQHLQLIADLAVAKATLKAIDKGEVPEGDINISNAGLIAYRIHKDMKDMKEIKAETFNDFDTVMVGLVNNYEQKANTGDATTDVEFKAIVGLAPSMRIAIVGTVNRNDNGEEKIGVITHIDKIAAIHYAIFRAAAEASHTDTPDVHDTKCKIFADTVVNDSLNVDNKLKWKPAIKAAIYTAGLCFTAVTFTL